MTKVVYKGKREIIRLTNDFHNTSADVRAGAGGVITARYLRRIKRALCPPADCQCGNELGERPSRHRADPVAGETALWPHPFHYVIVEEEV